jgi:hypothetical protein
MVSTAVFSPVAAARKSVRRRASASRGALMSGLFLAAAFQTGLLIAAWVLVRDSTIRAPGAIGSEVHLVRPR